MEKIIDTFSNRLTHALQIRNIKPIELAEKSGVDRGKISSYMSGRYKAKQDTLYLIATVLEVSPVWLMGYDVPMEENSNIFQEDIENKKVFSRNLKKYMRINNKSRSDICNDLQIAYTTFTDWYNGNAYPRIDKIELLARYFNIEKSDLIEEKHSTRGRIPVLGVVKAGYNYLVEENIIGYLTVNTSLDNENYFALQVKGNSMEPTIFEGDIAVVRKQNDFENGDIVVAIVNGNEATIKKAYKTDNGLLLQPANASIEPLLFTKNEVEDVPVKIIGVVYNITRNFKK